MSAQDNAFRFVNVGPQFRASRSATGDAVTFEFTAAGDLEITLSGDLSFGGHLLPATGTLDLGSASSNWRDLYLSGAAKGGFEVTGGLTADSAEIDSLSYKGEPINAFTHRIAGYVSDALERELDEISRGAADSRILRLPQRDLLADPEAGAVEYNGASIYGTIQGVRRALSQGNDVRTADQVVENTTTETEIHESPVAAHEFQAGKLYRLSLLGKITTDSASDFFTFRAKLGGTTILTAAMDAKNVSDAPLWVQVYLTIRSTGESGSYAAHIAPFLGDVISLVSPATGSIDTTAVSSLSATAQWDAASAGNILTIQQSLLEVVN